MLLKDMLNIYSFLDFPRAIGFPQQVEVQDFDQILYFYKKLNGKKPLYISHNAYKNSEVLYKVMFFDFDKVEGKEKELQDEVLRLCEYFMNNNYKFKLTFTGNSFHVFLYVKPFIANKNNIGVKRYMNKLKNDFNLKYLDLNSAEPKKLTRLLLSRYVKNDRITDRYVIPINIDDLTLDYNEIVEMSRYMNIHLQTGGEEVDLKQQLWQDVRYAEDNKSEEFDVNKLTDEKFINYMKIILNSFFDKVYNKHPSNNTRFILVLLLKNFGFGFNTTVNIVLRLSKLANWDNRDEETIIKHIKYIYDNNYRLLINNGEYVVNNEKVNINENNKNNEGDKK